MLRFYYCTICGNLIEMIDDSGANPVCCGQDMEELIPGTSDGAKEKHIPVCIDSSIQQDSTDDSTDTRIITIQVGEILHPMTEAHSIRWITLLTDQGVYRKILIPSQKPETQFVIHKTEKIVAIYAYCNLHGLWVNIR